MLPGRMVDHPSKHQGMRQLNVLFVKYFMKIICLKDMSQGKTELISFNHKTANTMLYQLMTCLLI